jgi:hypothetical protein
MWKVKRMNTAPIVVLATADGAGGIAAYLANVLAARHQPITHGADLMAAVPTTGVRAPNLTETLK